MLGCAYPQKIQCDFCSLVHPYSGRPQQLSVPLLVKHLTAEGILVTLGWTKPLGCSGAGHGDSWSMPWYGLSSCRWRHTKQKCALPPCTPFVHQVWCMSHVPLLLPVFPCSCDDHSQCSPTERDKQCSPESSRARHSSVTQARLGNALAQQDWFIVCPDSVSIPDSLAVSASAWGWSWTWMRLGLPLLASIQVRQHKTKFSYSVNSYQTCSRLHQDLGIACVHLL